MICKTFLVSFLICSVSMAQEPTETAAPTNPGVKEDMIAQDRSAIEKLLLPFEYSPDLKRDPFRIPQKSGPLNRRPIHGPFLPLQEIPLSEVRLKGVFIHPKYPKALFKIHLGNEKRIYKRLGLKDYIGEDFGYIAAIRPGKVVIVQTKEQNGENFSTTKTLIIEK